MKTRVFVVGGAVAGGLQWWLYHHGFDLPMSVFWATLGSVAVNLNSEALIKHVQESRALKEINQPVPFDWDSLLAMVDEGIAITSMSNHWIYIKFQTVNAENRATHYSLDIDSPKLGEMVDLVKRGVMNYRVRVTVTPPGQPQQTFQLSNINQAKLLQILRVVVGEQAPARQLRLSETIAEVVTEKRQEKLKQLEAQSTQKKEGK